MNFAKNSIFEYMKTIIFTIVFSVSVLMHSYAQERTVGLLLNTEESFNGYTLFSNSDDTYLIDNCGEVINTWGSQFAPGLGVYLTEEGDLLRTGSAQGSTINAGGAGGIYELFDWDGELLWSYRISNDTMRAHHDIELLPNGNFLALVWELMPNERAVELGRAFNNDIFMEVVLELKPIGIDEVEIVWMWKLEDHIVQDEFEEIPTFGVVSDEVRKLDFNFNPNGGNTIARDWIHINAIDYNPVLDQIALSSRELGEIWIIDHSTTTEEAKTDTGGLAGHGGDFLYRYGNPQIYGQGDADDQVLTGQHDIRWVEHEGNYSGALSVFNNLWDVGSSRVEIWEPPINGLDYDMENGVFGPNELLFEYNEEGFFGARVSGAEVLPNGNVLICEGPEGRFFEVNSDGELVWEYLNPVHSSNGPVNQGTSNFSAFTFRANRYAADFTGFIGRDLTPQGPIELNPLPNECIIFNSTNTDDTHLEIDIYSTIEGVIYMNAEQETQLTIFNNYGALVYSETVYPGMSEIDLRHLNSGVYFVNSLQERESYTFQMIKI